MATLLHVTGEGNDPLPPFAGHLVRNLEWHRYSPEAVDSAVDTVVVSPATPVDAVQLVVDLRDAGRAQAVVLLVDSSPGWRAVEGAFDQVSVVEGLESLRALLEDARADVDGDGPAPAPDEEQARRHIPRGGPRGMLKARLGNQAGLVGRHDDAAVWASLVQEGPVGGAAGRPTTTWAEEPTDAGTEILLDGAAVVTDEPAGPAPRVEPPRPRVEPTPSPAVTPRGSGRGRDPAARRQRREQEDPHRLVEALLASADRLYGVRETGTAVAGHVREAVGADAAAVLVPDGAVWSVAGAVGHRPLEERLVLDPDHWLVTEVAQVGHGVVVDDTDIARSRLTGAPLAAWPHLLAVPVLGVAGIVLMARSDSGRAFTPHDFVEAARALGEAEQLLASALAVRELARQLSRHADLDGPLG